MYAVVEFRATEEVELVPCTWIKEDRCFWPNVPGDKAVHLVKKGDPPGRDFSEYEINVKGIFGK